MGMVPIQKYGVDNIGDAASYKNPIRGNHDKRALHESALKLARKGGVLLEPYAGTGGSPFAKASGYKHIGIEKDATRASAYRSKSGGECHVGDCVKWLEENTEAVSKMSLAGVDIDPTGDPRHFYRGLVKVADFSKPVLVCMMWGYLQKTIREGMTRKTAWQSLKRDVASISSAAGLDAKPLGMSFPEKSGSKAKPYGRQIIYGAWSVVKRGGTHLHGEVFGKEDELHKTESDECDVLMADAFEPSDPGYMAARLKSGEIAGVLSRAPLVSVEECVFLVEKTEAGMVAHGVITLFPGVLFDDMPEVRKALGEKVGDAEVAKAEGWEGGLWFHSVEAMDLWGEPRPAVVYEDGTADVLKAEWTRAAINDLPDSAFLYIEPGGTKDEGGKTTPRSLRHFPVMGPDGKPDLPHLRNAIARIPQAKVPGLTDGELEALQEKARRMLEEAGTRKDGETITKAEDGLASKVREMDDVALQRLMEVLSAKWDEMDAGGASEEDLRSLMATKMVVLGEMRRRGMALPAWAKEAAEESKVLKDARTEDLVILWRVLARESQLGKGPAEDAEVMMAAADVLDEMRRRGMPEPKDALQSSLEVDTKKSAEISSIDTSPASVQSSSVEGDGTSDGVDSQSTVRIIKRDDELRFVLGVVLEPNDGKGGAPLDPDAHKDIYSAEDILETAHLYMMQFQGTGVMHQRETSAGEMKICESYVAAADFEVGGQKIRKGSWMLGARILSDDLWAKIKSGKLSAWSIDGRARKTPVKAAA